MSRARQFSRIVKQKGASYNESIKTGNYALIYRKTGYLNVTVGNKAYYFDERTNPSEINNDVIFVAFNGGKSAKNSVTVSKKQKKKQKITIRKK